MNRLSRILCGGVALLLGSLNAHAGGFQQANQSAAATGVSNAFAASASDASALAYNPSGIAWLSGANVTLGFDVEYRNSSVKLPAGIAPNRGTEPNSGYFFGSWSPLDSDWSGGVGFAPLYYINNDWSTGFGTTAGITKVTVDHAMADVVYAINSSLSVGVGSDWYITRATLTQGGNTFRGNDFGGIGGHASVMWKPAYAWSMGAMVRSGARIDFSGKASDSMSFKLPDQLSAGIAHDFADVWRLETDVSWTRWSALKDMHVKTSGVVTQPNAMNLRDTFTVMAGLTWTWRPNIQLRAGYAYDQGANKSADFSPVIADQDGHKVSIGAGGDIYNMHVDLAYQYGFFNKKATTGAYAGIYRDRRQSVLLSVSKRFE